MAPKYSWLLFDADGTLFDYDKSEARALRITFEQLSQPFELAHAEAYRRINGQIWQDFEKGLISQKLLRVRRFELLFETTGIKADPNVFSALYLQNLAQGTDLIDGAEETVSALSGNFQMALITNGLQDVQRPRLAQSIIGDYFAAVVISEEVGVAKPDAKIFDIAFRRMGDPSKNEVLMIGDSLSSDILGGSNYGIDTCWFNPQQRAGRPDLTIRYEINDLRQLLKVLGVAS